MSERVKNQISSYDDMLLMLKVFKGCIVTKVIPKINSPCHFKLIEIIERAKSNRKKFNKLKKDK